MNHAEEQLTRLRDNTLIGVYIRCQGEKFECQVHDVIEDFPEDAYVMLYGKGWRVLEKGRVLCPDCARKNSLLQKLNTTKPKGLKS